MKTKPLLAALLFACYLAAWPASAEETTWQTPCICEPYDYKYQDETRFVAIKRVSEENLTYFVADVQLRDASAFKTALSPSGFAPLSELVEGTDAVLAINADDYGAHKYGVIIRNGELLRVHDTTRHMLIVDANGDLRTVTDRDAEQPQALAERLMAENVWQTFEFGPVLVADGAAVSFPSAFDLISTRASRKEPRTAIGQIAALHYIVIVVDGRQAGYSEGISLQDLQQLFIAYGAQTALNLDGGGSTELWFDGEIINRPSGGRERTLSDILYF